MTYTEGAGVNVIVRDLLCKVFIVHRTPKFRI